MKLLLYVTVCFTAVCANNSWDFIAEPDEALFISDRSEVSINEHRGEDATSGIEIQDSTDEDYEDYTDDVDEQTGDMAEILGRARRCRKRLGGRCQNANKYPSCKKGYKASPKGRPFCTSKHRMCCYPDKQTTTPVPKGLVLIGGQYLTFSTERVTWAIAKSRCISLNGKLASLDNPQAFHAYVSSKYRGQYFWIGASDISLEGTWTWINGKSLGSFPWPRGQPDNYGNNEDCLEWGHGYNYNDDVCTKALGYVCEH